MKFPPSGSFEDFSLHELAIHMIRTRYSGSLELDYPDNVLRIFQFDKGNLCAASSNAKDEQLDNIIRADREPQLSKEQKAYLQERLDSGMKYGKALVETALMSAAELLTYNSKQAAAIFAGALRGSPTHYKTERGGADQYRPLPIDPYNIIKKSILTDVDSEFIRDLLGDENTAYMKGDNISGGSKALQEDEEIRAILSHLDGRRSIREISARIGLNPDRTSRMLLMLKMMDWIEPAIGGDEDFVDERQYIETPDELANASEAETTTGKDFVEDNAEILQLLGSEDAKVDIDAPIHGLPPLDDSDSVVLSSGSHTPIREEPQVVHDEPEGDFRGVLVDQGKKKSGGKLMKIALPVAIALIVVAIVSAGLLIGSSKPAAKEGSDLSFYPPEVEQEQLPLDKDFTEARETSNEPIRIDLNEKPQEQPVSEVKREETSKPEQTSETPDPQENTASTQRENVSSQPQKEEPAEQKKETPVVVQPEEKKIITPQDSTPAETQTEQPKQQSATTTGSLDEIQPRALDVGFRGNWSRAAQMWAGPISAMSGDAQTLLIKRTNSDSDVSSVFERFANSARMRNEFFVIKRGNTFFICWGLFPESSAAQEALRALPDRISQYRPAVRRLSEVLP